MTWSDRLQEAAYTGATSKTRKVFAYEDVQHTFRKRTAAFEFPEFDGAFIQDLGRSGRKFPLRVFFYGADYDLEATEFLALLGERGIGRLEHPIYGTADVVPYGTIERQDKLVSGGNQAVVDVTFYETVRLVATSDAASSVSVKIESVTASVAEAYEPLSSPRAISRVKTLADRTEATGISRVPTIQDALRRSLNEAIFNPTTVAFQVVTMLRSQVPFAGTMLRQVKVYADLARTIFEDPPDQFETSDLFAQACLVASVETSLLLEPETAREALDTVDLLLTQFGELAEWQEQARGDDLDTGETYQPLQDLVASAIGALVEQSFSAKQERAITLDRDYALLELEAKLYGTLDENLDLLIRSNALTGSEILNVPRGRSLLYYV